MKSFIQALAQCEGFYEDGTISNRNHNPGNIEFGRFAVAQGATGRSGPFAVFPDEETGFACLRALIVGGYDHLTVREAVRKWVLGVASVARVAEVDICELTGMDPEMLLTPENMG